MSGHLVQFYESGALLADSTAQFLGEGFAAGDVAVVIGTPAHREALDRRLSSGGLSAGSDRCVALDAASTMSQFMMGDWPDEVRFRDVILAALSRVGRSGGGSGRVRAFGEMVALLAIDGRWEAARRLEELWNVLVAEQPLTLLCAYPAFLFGDQNAERLDTICAQHTAVIPAAGRHRRPSASPGRAAARARQRLSFVGLVERAIAAVRPLSEERGHVLTISWPEQDLHVEGDRSGLERVLVSLLANAMKHTPARGRIRVSVAREERHAVLRIRDSGAGIVPGVLSSALDPGSAVTEMRGVAEMHGGVVEVRSSGRRQGVEFVVRLPIAGDAPEGRAS